MNQRRRFTSIRRLGAVTTGLGAITGGMLLAAFGQVAVAPTAQAQPDDALADILADVQSSIAHGAADFSSGALAFDDGGTSLALAYDLAGVDNQLFGSAFDVAVNGIEALTGNPESGPFYLSVVDVPDGFTATLAEAQEYIVDAQANFTSGLADLANGDVIDGLESVVYSFETALVDAPNALILGLSDSLFGGAVTFS